MRLGRSQERLLPVRVFRVDVDELESALLERRDRGVDVVGLEREVMQPLAARLQELGEEPFAGRLEQLDLPAVRIPKLEPAPRVRLVAAHQVLAAERVTVQLQRGLIAWTAIPTWSNLNSGISDAG